MNNNFEGIKVAGDTALSLLSGLKDLSMEEREKISALVREIFEGRRHKGLSEDKSALQARLNNELLKLVYGFLYTEKELSRVVSKFAYENGLVLVSGEVGAEINQNSLIEVSSPSVEPDEYNVLCFDVEPERGAVFVYKKFVNEDNSNTYLPYYL